jgi:hypothetical protein
MLSVYAAIAAPSIRSGGTPDPNARVILLVTLTGIAIVSLFHWLGL